MLYRQVEHFVNSETSDIECSYSGWSHQHTSTSVANLGTFKVLMNYTNHMTLTSTSTAGNDASGTRVEP